MDPLAKLSELMRKQAKLISEFNALSPGRHFTADGHLIGSIGEMIAALENGLELAASSTRGWDAIRTYPNGRNATVEIKATQNNRVTLRHTEAPCDELIVLKVDMAQGRWATEYDGPAQVVWKSLPQKMPSNGQRSISLAQLRVLQGS